MNKLQKLLDEIDWRWIQDNPGRTYDLLKDLIAMHIHDKEYIQELHRKNMMLHVLVGKDD